MTDVHLPPGDHLPGAQQGLSNDPPKTLGKWLAWCDNKPSEDFKPPLQPDLFLAEPSQWRKHLPPICSLLPARHLFSISQRFCLESKSCILEWTTTPGLPMTERLIPAVDVAFSSERIIGYVWQLQFFQEGEKYSSVCW